jgi:protein-S-isoprenylcysteine O-methyltransferase Ste14
MSYYTELHIGLWNAWIGSLLILLTMMVTTMNKELAKRMMDMSWYTPRDKRAAMTSMIFMYAMMIFTIWVPLKIGTPWFYIGLCLFIIGFVGNAIATHNYATTPKDEAIRKGMYRISRNPLYLCFSVMFLGLILASLSLPLLVIWMIYNIMTHFVILGEERYCLETYGESYNDYMKKVQRYFLFF